MHKPSVRNGASRGNALIFTAITVAASLLIAVLAVDVPFYLATQNQLQTAVNAAALAGAAALPQGNSFAEDAAVELAQENPIAGHILSSEEMDFSYNGNVYQVSASTYVPTLLAKMLCVGGFDAGEEQDGDTVTSQSCNWMKVYAHAKAQPAARDTIIVIDNSTSMTSMGGGRPMVDVKAAAQAYVETVRNLNNESIDRIGLVTFAYDAQLVKPLTSQQDSPNFNNISNAIGTSLYNGISIYNARGWNTNYARGLEVAVNELKNNGRPNAEKIIIYMTDGWANLPAPPAFYNYSYYQPYYKCVSMVDNSPQVKSLCYYRYGRKYCPTLPSSSIPDSYISSEAVACGQEYTSYLIAKAQEHIQDAADNDITIHTVAIFDPNKYGVSIAILQRLLKDPTWTPELVDDMADMTDGQKFQTDDYDPGDLTEVYNNIAEDVRIRLSS